MAEVSSSGPTTPGPNAPGPGAGKPGDVGAAQPDGSVEWGDVGVLLSAWYRRAREAQMSHYAAAARCTAMNRWLGVPSIVFSAAAGTTIFATLQSQSTPTIVEISAGFVALAAGALSALQTFLGPNERADKHLSAGATYGAIRREIEQLQVLRSGFAGDLYSALTDIRNKLDEASLIAPNVGEGVWRKAQDGIAHTNRPDGFTESYLENQRRTLD